ncbi:MAG: hypothetical protein HRU38_25635 [Saccharospirillaceae bacterium]|nr:hypothetical protein [Saccharospirillaceae bacterium]
MKQLTVKEAIKQGYKYYGFGNKEWQTAEELDDGVFAEVDEDDWDDLVLFEKNASQPTIDSRTIANMLADYIADQDSNDCGRDDDCVYKTVEEMDFKKVAENINKELEQHKYWMITDIKLVK